MTDKYFIQLWDLIEVEVSKEQFIETEKLCGFFPKIEGEVATGGFGFYKQGMKIKGIVVRHKSGTITKKERNDI